MKPSTKWQGILAAAAICAVITGTALAQSQAGNLYGVVTDDQGTPLPGVTVEIELAGGGAAQTHHTDARGEFRFLGLAPAPYFFRAKLEGFATVEYPSVQIHVNRNTTLEVELQPAIEETITVTSETPLLDARKIATGTTVSQVELERVPNARDPWAVLQTVPGVQTDRINVGGSESGQQSQFTGPGSTGDDAVWAIDGVVITDMAGLGSSPSYYNFDAFEEMQVTTGGSDVTLATSGVTMNMVTRRGTNEWRGSGRYILADDQWQSDLDLDESEFGRDFDGDGPARDQGQFKQGNRIVSVKDYGVEVGGPIARDRVWIWANYGTNEIDLLTVNDFSDATELEDYGGKLNAQVTPANSAVAFYNFANKVKIGRNGGPTRAQPTTWNQDGPTDIAKLEDTHVFSSSFYLTGMASYVGGKFTLTPQGGVAGDQPVWDEDFVWQQNFFHHETDRPQEQAKLDGNYFFDTGKVSHDLKFGAGYRQVDLESRSIIPGGGVRFDGYLTFGTAHPVFAAWRDTANVAKTTYESLYLQDTMTLGNLTLNAGLRFEQQDGEVDSVTVPGVPGFETLPDGTPLLPRATTPAFEQPFSWEDVTPRLGLTYALGEQRKTLLRASFSRFAQQLGQGFTIADAPGPQPAYAYFYYEDADGDGNVTVDEILGFENGPLWTNGYDPLAQDTPNVVDPGFDAPLTDELIVGLEHALRPELVVGVTATLRNIHDMVEAERLLVDETGALRAHRHGDYVRGERSVARPDGSSFSVPVWRLRPGLVDNGGFAIGNGDREQDYRGLSLLVNKRLSNRWMLRGNFTVQDWEWDIPASELEDPNVYLGGLNDDGGPVLQGSGTGSGPKGGVYIHAGWSYSVTGLYQVAPERRWGFNVSAALNGREGYPVPYFVTVPGAFATGTAALQATGDAAEFQLDDVHLVDLRLEKEVDVGDVDFTVGVELFNALNESTVLQRQHLLGSAISNHVLEVVSPRVWRLGVRFRFD